jgi:hypothetical protein
MRTKEYQALIRRGFDYSVGDRDCIHLHGIRGGKHGGYVSVRWKGVSRPAHRVSYTEWHGDIPPGSHIDHTCHNEAAARGECAGGLTCLHRGCINPMHLEAKTHQENMLASPLTAPGRGPVGWAESQTQKTHCPQGHEYSEANTYIWHRPETSYIARMCRSCIRERARERRANSLKAGLTSNGTPWKRKPKERK